MIQAILVSSGIGFVIAAFGWLVGSIEPFGSNPHWKKDAGISFAFLFVGLNLIAIGSKL